VAAIRFLAISRRSTQRLTLRWLIASRVISNHGFNRDDRIVDVMQEWCASQS
jgi:hypothetical protein